MASQNDFSNRPIDELAAMRLRFEKQTATFSKSPAPQETVYTHSMTSPTREEFEAKLETIEARMDLRVATINSKIDTLVTSLEGREQTLAERDKRIELIAQSAQKSAEQAASLKSSMWLAAISIIFSIVIASAGFYLAIQANTLSVAQMVTATFQAAQSIPSSEKSPPPPPSQKK